MAAIVSNNAKGTLTASISATDTLINLQAGEGSLFPATGATDFFYVTLIDGSDNTEIVKCTSRSDDALTVVRLASGHDDFSSNKTFAQNDKVELRLTASTLNDKTTATDGNGVVSNISFSVTGTTLTITTTNYD